MRVGISFKMLVGFVSYVKSRHIGSTYPSINARPSTKALKTEKKIRRYLLAKLKKVVNALPFLRYKDTIIMGNSIELKGMCIILLAIHCKTCLKGQTKQTSEYPHEQKERFM